MYGFDKKDEFSGMSGAEAAKAAANIYRGRGEGTEQEARDRELERLVNDSELMRDNREQYYDTQYKRMQQGMKSQNELASASSAPQQQ